MTASLSESILESSWLFSFNIIHSERSTQNWAHRRDRQDTQDRQDRQKRQDRHDWHFYLTFQDTCLGQFSQPLRWFDMRRLESTRIHNQSNYLIQFISGSRQPFVYCWQPAYDKYKQHFLLSRPEKSSPWLLVNLTTELKREQQKSTSTFKRREGN